MKVTLESDLKKKAELIQTLAKSIDDHTTRAIDVWYLARAMQICFEFIAEQRFIQGTDLLINARQIRTILAERSGSVYVNDFDNMADAASGVMIISNQCIEGLTIGEQMNDDLQVILETVI
jgi:hypothetical protein